MDSEILSVDFECTSCKRQKKAAERIPVMRVIEKLDEHFKTNDLAGAVRLLRYWEGEARGLSDFSGELSVVNEELGLYRKTNDADSGLAAVKRALELIELTDSGNNASGATIMLNAATTLKAFGKADEAIPIYERVNEIYSSTLEKNDLRFAAFYNNYATSLVDLYRFDEAEKLYSLASEITSASPEGLLDAAVSYVNMAHMYEKWQGAESEKIEEYLNLAEKILFDDRIEKDAYYAFVCEKCAPAFDYFGFFVLAGELREISRKIYEGN